MSDENEILRESIAELKKRTDLINKIREVAENCLSQDGDPRQANEEIQELISSAAIKPDSNTIT